MRTDVLITYSEYKTLPETGPRYQLIEGDLLMSPAPKPQHQVLAFRLARLLAAAVEKRGLGVVLMSPVDVILSETNVVQPDVVFLSRARERYIREDGIFGPPDLCVEVLSPTTRELDLGFKRRLYARQGVSEYWVADPQAGTVTVFPLAREPLGEGAVFRAGEQLVSEVLPDIGLDVGAVFTA